MEALERSVADTRVVPDRTKVAGADQGESEGPTTLDDVNAGLDTTRKAVDTADRAMQTVDTARRLFGL